MSVGHVGVSSSGPAENSQQIPLGFRLCVVYRALFSSTCAYSGSQEEAERRSAMVVADRREGKG